jgi:putative flippase GtrA
LQHATVIRRARQFLRYGTVSLISTAISLVVLGTLVALQVMPAAWANIVATFIGTVPSFELNRRWVWGHTGQRSVGKQVVPFFALTFIGLGLSTVCVYVASHWAQNRGMDAGQQAIIAQLANLVGFGSLWLIQFVILDRILFKAPADLVASAEVLASAEDYTAAEV